MRRNIAVLLRTIASRIDPQKQESPESTRIPIEDVHRTEYEKSFEDVSKNANYVLVINGLLLSFFIAAQGLIFSNTMPGLSNLSITTSTGLLVNVTPLGNPVSGYFRTLDITIITTFCLSILACVGCFLPGLFPRMVRNKKYLDDLKAAEKRAIDSYILSLVFLFFSIVGLLSFYISSVEGENQATIILTYILYVGVIIIFTLYLIPEYLKEFADEYELRDE
jgi:hypothetical protein